MIGAAGSDSIPQLAFSVDDARAVRPAVTPTVRLTVGIDAGGRAIRSLALTAQVRIAPERRSYDERDERRLAELFGAPEQWAQSLRPLPWATLALNVAPFDGDTSVELDLPATYDFDVAAAKYLHAVGEDGVVPVELLFSGTVFWSGPGGALRVGRISWEADASYRLPVRVWRDAIDGSFPNEAWLRLPRELFDRLNTYRTDHGLPTWEATVRRLLERP